MEAVYLVHLKLLQFLEQPVTKLGNAATPMAQSMGGKGDLAGLIG